MEHSRIIGAGLTGLIAGYAFPKATIFEAGNFASNHNALLRFRSDAVSVLTGIPFRKVKVRKSIFVDGKHVAPDLRLANYYSQKLFGNNVLLPDRSIWNLELCERYVAPIDFYLELVHGLKNRIQWNSLADRQFLEQGCISTMPIPELLKIMNIDVAQEFKSAPIKVVRAKIPGADVFQTIYFPDPSSPIYRASITGDLLIVEGIDDIHVEKSENDWISEAAGAFGINGRIDYVSPRSNQKYGKIVEIDSGLRKGILFSLTYQFGIYSLGRFATWRNILLDDVVQDIKVIQAIGSGQYDWRKKYS